MVDLRLQFKSLAWNHGGKLAEYALVYLFSVSAARMLGVAGNGTYIILVAFAQTGLLITSFGFETTLHKFVPEFQSVRPGLHKILRVLFSFRVAALIALCGILFFGFPFLVSFFAAGEAGRSLAGILCVYAFFTGVNNFFAAVLVGQSRTRILSLLRISVRLCELAGIILLGRDGLTLGETLGVIAAGGCVGSIALLAASFTDLAGETSKSDLKPVFSFAGTMWLNMFVVFILGKQMDVLLLGRLTTDVNQIAFYDVAMTLAQIIVLGTTVGMGGVMLSTFAGFAHDRQDMIGRFWRFWVKMTILLIVPLLVLLAFGADFAINTIYGPAYGKSVSLLRIIVGLIILERLFGSGLNTDALLAGGKQRTVLRISIGCGVVNIAAAVATIPFIGALGAIVATGAGNLLASMLTAVVLRRTNRMNVPFLFWIKIVAISMAACIVPIVMRVAGISLSPASSLILTVLLWGIIAKGIGIFSEDDIKWLGEMNESFMRVGRFFPARLSGKRIVPLP